MGHLLKVGTWTNSPANPAAGTFNSTGALYSVTAGDTISGSITGTVAAIRVYNTSNGGNAIVAIDGDYTRANRLPTFTLADYDSGNCRWSDVGKRYISTYGPASFNDCICLAADLDAGTHTITVEVTGKYPAGSSAARVYVEGFAGCNGGLLFQPMYMLFLFTGFITTMVTGVHSDIPLSGHHLGVRIISLWGRYTVTMCSPKKLPHH